MVCDIITMRFKAWHLYLIAIGLSAITGYLREDGIGLGYDIAFVSFFGGFLLLGYYLTVYFWKKDKIKNLKLK